MNPTKFDLPEREDPVTLNTNEQMMDFTTGVERLMSSPVPLRKTFPGSTIFLNTPTDKYDNLIIPTLRQFILKLKRQAFSKNFKSLTTYDYELINDPGVFFFEGVLQKKLEFSNKILSLYHKFLDFLPVINPFGIKKIVWDLTHLLLILFIFFWIPIELCFFLQLSPNFNLAIIFFLGFDIFLNFNTAYYQNGFLNFQRNRIRSHYLKNSFWRDLTTTLIFLVDFFFHQDEGVFDPFGCTKIVFYLRIKTMEQIYDEMIEIFKLRRTSLLDLFNLFSLSYFILHVFACLWFFVAANQTQSPTWLTKQPNVIDENNFVKYIYSLYWATVTIMTVGYGDISATNIYEVVFSIVTIFIGCVVFGYIINTVGYIIGEINKEKSIFKQNIYIINKYMERKKINQNLQMKIRAYLKFLWQEEFTQNAEMEAEIISKLSGSLKEELLLEAHGAILNNFPMFYANFSENFLKKLLYKIKEVRLTPEDLIFQENQMHDNDIYFLLKGKVQLFLGNKDSPTVIKNLQEGECFGEISFFSGIPRTASAQSKDFTTLFYIKNEDFMELLAENPEDYEKYCMIRDQIMQKKFKSIGAYCFCCQESDHLVRDCGRIHLVPNIEKIVKSKNPNAKHISLCSKQSRQFRVKFNARKGAMLLNEIRAIYMQSVDEESLSISSSMENQNVNQYSELGNNTVKSIDDLLMVNSRSKFENSVTFHNIDATFDNKRRRASKLKSLTSSPKMFSKDPKDLFFPSFDSSTPHPVENLRTLLENKIEEEKHDLMNESIEMNAVPFFGRTISRDLEMKSSLKLKMKPPIPKPHKPFRKQKTDVWGLKKTKEKEKGESLKKIVLAGTPPILNRSVSIENTIQQRIPSKKITQTSSNLSKSVVFHNQNNNEMFNTNGMSTTKDDKENDLLVSFDKMCNFKNYFPDGNLFKIIIAMNLKERKKKRDEFLKHHNQFALYLKRAKTNMSSSPTKKFGKNKIVPEDKKTIMMLNPVISSIDKERTHYKRVSNIFREKTDSKSFFQKSKKLSFYDVVFQILTNKELRKILQAQKEKVKQKGVIRLKK